METYRSFYQFAGKRFFDFCSATLGLTFFWPLLAVIALASKCLSRGPVLYLQERIGKNGRRFRIVKFRTMKVGADISGPSITIGGDRRITSLGRILRAVKLDELPQLWNVLKGDMSLVGPRPEVALYVKSYTEEQKKVLSVRPGITDPACLAYRYEEELLSRQPDPERHYQDVLLPHKLSLNAEYIRNISLKYDLVILLQTVSSLLLKRPESLQNTKVI